MSKFQDFRVPAPTKKADAARLSGADTCRWCSCRPCGHDCVAVLRGTSACPPRTPLVFMPKHVQDAVAAKRRLLGMDAAGAEPDDTADVGD
jgi:hypothetical protein